MRSQLVCEPFYMDWSTVGRVHITDNDSPTFGRFVLPEGRYDIQLIDSACAIADASFSPALTLTNPGWSDVGALSPAGDFIAPDASVGIVDVVLALDVFRGLPSGTKTHFDLVGVFATGTSGRLDGVINIIEVSTILDEFRGLTNGFPFPAGPAPCTGGSSGG